MGVCSDRCRKTSEEIEILEKAGNTTKDTPLDGKESEEIEKEFNELLKGEINGMAEAVMVMDALIIMDRKLGKLLLHFLMTLREQEGSTNYRKEQKKHREERLTTASGK